MKTAEQIEGLEYDWLSLDQENCVALFSTAGCGYAPMQFLKHTEAHDIAIEVILAARATTIARFFPSLSPELKNTWKLVAERGLFAYDCSPDGGPYRLVAAPAIATSFHDLPHAAKNSLVGARLSLLFASETVITADFLRAEDAAKHA
jgi:hypothetical protein